MVYNPYQKKQTGMGYSGRQVSGTRPNIRDEEDEMKESSNPPSFNNAAAQRAAQKVMQQPITQQKVPDVLPTEGAPPTGFGSTKVYTSGNPNDGPQGGGGLGQLYQGMGKDELAGNKAENSILAGSDKSFLNVKDLAGHDLLGGGGKTLPDVWPSTTGGGEEEEEEEETGDDGSMKDRLIAMLMDKMNESPEERAQIEAGRALVAARAQAGRGQMGMSGGMLGLQSEVMGDASREAEDYLFGQQLAAGKLGAGMEAERANQLLNAIAVKDDLDMSDEDFRRFLQGLGFTLEEIDSINNNGGGGGGGGGNGGSTFPGRDKNVRVNIPGTGQVTMKAGDIIDQVIAANGNMDEQQAWEYLVDEGWIL